MKTEIGISNKHLTRVAEVLNQVLADQTVLYIKTRNAHWNVEGPDFHAMHLFFESQYTELEKIIDEVAERVRTLGHYAVATMKEYLEITHLPEETRENYDSTGFIRELVEDHESVIMYMREHIEQIENEWEDAGTADFITGIMEKHSKMAWMLRAHLK